ncbi:GIN domain-containing protein [Pseudomonas veronii]
MQKTRSANQSPVNCPCSRLCRTLIPPYVGFWFHCSPNPNIHVSGTGNIFVGGTINVGGRHGGVTMQLKGRCIVGVALPEAPSIRIKGSGDVTLYDLQQAVLDLGVQGSGDITAFGRVDLLDAEVAGSGDVDASELVATSAKLSVVGCRLPAPATSTLMSATP